MNRAKKRKIAKLAKDADMQAPQHRFVLEDALGSCRNDKTREQLRSRILRGN